MNATTRAMMSTLVRTKAGSRGWPLESLRTLWDRSFARRHVPASRASSSANLTPVSSTDRCPSRTFLGGASLIANLELKFHVSPIRITKLRFSNRKYSPLFRPPWRISPASPRATRRRRTSPQQISNRYTAIRFSRNQNKTNAILNF